MRDDFDDDDEWDEADRGRGSKPETFLGRLLEHIDSGVIGGFVMLVIVMIVLAVIASGSPRH